MTKGRYVSYLRVSTDRQGRSGLGVEAQRKAVEDYLNGGRSQLLAEFVEVESGKNNDRPHKFSGRFIFIIVILAILYAVAMWFALISVYNLH